MSCPKCGSQGPETEEELFRRILLNMRYANTATIERFLNNYRLGKKVYDQRDDMLLDYMQHMFGPGQGKSAFDLFKAIHGESV
jgi:hypothetical protein